MSVDLPVDQALVLKKRARRRLVGAVALVLLMLVILPQVLQDRSAQTKPESIKITMPEATQDEVVALAEPQTPPNSNVEVPAAESQATEEAEVFDTPNVESAAALKEAEDKEVARRKALAKAAQTQSATQPRAEVKAEAKKDEPVKAVKPVEKAPVVNPVPDKVVENKAVENKAQPKSEGSFTVQVGVYSDVSNVKRLQEQLKQAGFATTTEKTTTPKGEGLRLKAGKFSSRQDAMSALVKIKELGLPGIVISND